MMIVLYIWCKKMRLSPSEIDAIKTSANQVFGKNVRIIVFGSRVHDDKKGGDIDLLIDTKIKANLNIQNKIEFLVLLKSKIGDQKIDILLNKDNTKSIVQTALKTGVVLC